jgi:hypothetical protein
MPLLPSRLLPLAGAANRVAGAQDPEAQVEGAGNPVAAAQAAGARVVGTLEEVEVQVAARLALCRRRLCQSSKVGSFCCTIQPPHYLCVVPNQQYLQDLRFRLHSWGRRFSNSRPSLATILKVDTYTYYLDVSPSSFVDCFAISTVGYLTKVRRVSDLHSTFGRTLRCTAISDCAGTARTRATSVLGPNSTDHDAVMVWG